MLLQLSDGSLREFTGMTVLHQPSEPMMLTKFSPILKAFPFPCSQHLAGPTQTYMSQQNALRTRVGLPFDYILIIGLSLT